MIDRTFVIFIVPLQNDKQVHCSTREDKAELLEIVLASLKGTYFKIQILVIIFCLNTNSQSIQKIITVCFGELI